MKYLKDRQLEFNKHFLKENSDIISTASLCKYFDRLPQAYIWFIRHDLNWKYISVNFPLKELIIIKYMDFVCWKDISSHQVLSEVFMRIFKHILDWDLLSANQKMSEMFIAEHKDLVHWSYILKNQAVSLEFIQKYRYLV